MIYNVQIVYHIDCALMVKLLILLSLYFHQIFIQTNCLNMNNNNYYLLYLIVINVIQFKYIIYYFQQYKI